MSGSAFASIQAAIVQALKQAPTLADGRVYANRLRAVAQQHPTYIVVRTDQAAARENVLGFRDWETLYTVEIYARTVGAGADPIAAVDALLTAAWKRLSSLQPPALGVMQVAPQPAIDWQVDDGETPLVCAVLPVVCMHLSLLPICR